MDKNGVVTFKDWDKGMVKHPIYGFGLLQNVEVFENKGIAKLKNRAVALDGQEGRSLFSPTALPIAEKYSTTGDIYTLCAETGSGVVYKNGSSIQSGLGIAWDIEIYKDYLWVRSQTVLSAYGPLSSAGAQWFSNVGTGFDQKSYGKILRGQDDFLYFGNGNYVAKMEVTASGTVGVAPTVSLNLTALDLPDGQYVSSLEEFGTKIAIATHSAEYFTSRGNQPGARLYMWNRQLGTLGNPGLADLPVIFNENGMNAIKQHANKLYISAGTQGNIYVSDGTNFQKIATLPYSESGVYYNSSVYPNAISISPQGTLLIGVSGSQTDLTSPGIYEVDISSGGYSISFRTPSSITDNNTIKIGFINSKNYQTLRFGWENGSTYGLDETDFRMYANYGGIIETQLVPVGNHLTPKTFQHIEWDLAEPLVSGQNIRISYRKNSKEDYTEIGTWGYSTVGGVISYTDKCPITNAEYVQLKVELDQVTTAQYGSNINLITVKIW